MVSIIEVHRKSGLDVSIRQARRIAIVHDSSSKLCNLSIGHADIRQYLLKKDLVNVLNSITRQDYDDIYLTTANRNPS